MIRKLRTKTGNTTLMEAGMPYFADNLKQFDSTYGTEGQRNVKVDSGECVAFIKKEVAALTKSSAHISWKRGKIVKGNPRVTPGTAIGFFDENGDYASAPGKSHVAIFVSQDAKGITVWHQYHGKSVHRAVLYFKSANPHHHFRSESMNGDNFYVIEPVKDQHPDSF
jgi:hypothetical protein